MTIISPNLNNGKWWRTDDYHAPNLSKASLGNFMYLLCKEGAYIGNVWVFNKRFNRSPVYFMVYMTDEMKDRIESQSKVRFAPPQSVKVNSGRGDDYDD
jgi:hypothetical protein